MRTSEWIQCGFAVLLSLAAWIRPLTAPRRWVVTLLAAFAIFLVAAARLSVAFLSAREVSILRDWLPVLLMLIPYWQTGRFFLGPNPKIQHWLVELDRRWLGPLAPFLTKLSRAVRLSLEFAYTSCYALVPLGLGVLYTAGLRDRAGAYWFIVLAATYPCYAITLFVPALPPRNLADGLIVAVPKNKGRAFNHAILKYGSIQAISFPSAHVASTLAASLVLLRFVPAAGVLFFAIALWIAVAAVVERYHYALDVLLGAALPLAVFAACTAHWIPSSLLAARVITLATGL